MMSYPSDKTASIHLDYGVDSAAFDFDDLFICQRGLRIRTRWSFDLDTELSVNFQVADAGVPGGTRLFKTQGIVADCHRDDASSYVVTVVFLEVTDDIRAAVADLAADSHGAYLAG